MSGDHLDRRSAAVNRLNKTELVRKQEPCARGSSSKLPTVKRINWSTHRRSFNAFGYVPTAEG